MNTLNRVLNQIKAYPFTFFILVLSLSLSIGLITTTLYSINKAVEIERYLDKYQINNKISFSLDFEEQVDMKAIIKAFSTMSVNSNLLINSLSVETDLGMVNPMIEYWKTDEYNKLPLLEGESIRKSSLDRGDKLCMVGRAFIPYITKENGKQFVRIDHEKYEITGIIGTDKGNSPYLDHKIVIPITSLTERAESKLQSQKSIPVVLYGDQTRLLKDYDTVKNQISIFKVNNADFSSLRGSSPYTHLGNLGNQITFIITVYVLALINAVNIAVYWIKERRVEIAIKKAFGISNSTIAFSFYSEMLIVFLFSSLLVCIVQIWMSPIIEQWVGYPYKITLTDIINHAAFVFITSLLVVIIPLISSRNIQPVELMRKV
ncbi:ABC transporter permease [Paenibacillus elgii]|uniref:ABC transporter permease n=1 Tax=Paenibacillus elgii TaxID=189691 RepID=UPI00203BA0D7|nr:ABC transporter permease [Paenibacillus elgii]